MTILAKCVSVAVVAALLGLAASTFAQTASTNATASAPKAKSKPLAGVVAAVDNDAKTLTLKDHDKPIHITSKTKITKDGQPALLSDITAGESVSVRAKEDESGNPVATSIHIGKAKAKKAKTADAKPKADTSTAPTTPPQ